MSFLAGSPYDGYDRAPLRIGLTTVAGVVFLAETFTIAGMLGDQHYQASHAVPTSPALAWGVFALIVVALLFHALDRRPLAAGIVALGGMLGLSLWQTALFGSPSRNSFFPGAMLFGWVLGQLWALVLAGDDARGARGRPFRERMAEAGAIGCLAAAYVGSASSKLLKSGLGWVNPDQLRWLLLAQEPLAGWSWLAAYRTAILENPSFASFLALLTLVVEGGALVLLLGPRLRLFWGVLITGLHLNILLLCTMPYLEPVTLVLLFAVPWPALLRRPRMEDPLTTRRPELLTVDLPDSMWIVLSAVVIAGWLAPWGWHVE
ncbi:MAG: hypothetical protein MUF64_21205 [Polyangiaceae bacterium]|nr:hypothetical protein [Polyangiaceae bacterium]